MARANSVIETTFNEATRELVYTVAPEEGWEGGEIRLAIDTLSDEVHERGYIAGLTQRVGDAAAIPYEKKGRKPTNLEKFTAMRKVADTLESGVWSLRGEGDGAPDGLLRQALMRCLEKSEKEVNEILASMSRKVQSAMLGDPEIAPIVAAIKAEQAKRQGIDTTSMLAKLKAPKPE